MDFSKFKSSYLTGVIFLLTMQAGDVISTCMMIGGDARFAEMNPIMSGAVLFPTTFLMAKMIGVGAIVALAEIMRKTGHSHVAHSVVWVTAGFSACVLWSNLMIGLLVFGII